MKMKTEIHNFLENSLVEKFIVVLIFMSLVIFIMDTDVNFHQRFNTAIRIFELFSITVFTIEYILRAMSLKNIKDIFKPQMLVDLFAILPFYLTLSSFNAVFLRVLRLSKLLRIAKITRYTKALENIKNAFIYKKSEITVIAVIFLTGITISSILIYFAEYNTHNEAFKSIPASFWWAVITFTSVGYGDACPVTTAGKIIGSFSAIMGVGMHGLLIGVIGAAFVDGIQMNKNNAVAADVKEMERV